MSMFCQYKKENTYDITSFWRIYADVCGEAGVCGDTDVDAGVCGDTDVDAGVCGDMPFLSQYTPRYTKGVSRMAKITLRIK